MGELLQLLEHLITAGPARNPGELDRLMGLLEQARERFTQAEQAAAPAPATTNAGAVPPVIVTPVPDAGQLPGGGL